MKLACVSTVGSGLPPRWFHLLNQPAKAVSRSSRQVRITNASPVTIIGNQRAPIIGRWRQKYSYILYGGGDRSSPPVPVNGIAEVPTDALSVKAQSSKSQRSANRPNHFSMIKEGIFEARKIPLTSTDAQQTEADKQNKQSVKSENCRY